MTDAPPVPAATVMLLRPAAEGVEVLLLRRNTRSGFMPDMWVFPGGRVDAADHAIDPSRIRGGERWSDLCDDPARARALGVAAVRETFEESGVWLGDGEPPAEVRSSLASGAVEISTLVERYALRIDLRALRPWARWITPPGEGRRFDTAFFAVALPQGAGAHAEHDAAETVASGWVSPRAALAEGFAGRPVAPPTFCVLTELAALRSPEDVWAGERDLRPVQPVRAIRDDRLSMLLPGSEGHPEPARPGLPRRLDLGLDQWVPVL
jgi:8-oxo-dGTP pyrophosphatase MutT (NUDIX family)